VRGVEEEWRRKGVERNEVGREGEGESERSGGGNNVGKVLRGGKRVGGGRENEREWGRREDEAVHFYGVIAYSIRMLPPVRGVTEAIRRRCRSGHRSTHLLLTHSGPLLLRAVVDLPYARHLSVLHRPMYQDALVGLTLRVWREPTSRVEEAVGDLLSRGLPYPLVVTAANANPPSHLLGPGVDQTVASEEVLVDGIQVHKGMPVSQSKSGNVWIYSTVCTGYTWSPLTISSWFAMWAKRPPSAAQNCFASTQPDL
jgi:hypothetical protein